MKGHLFLRVREIIREIPDAATFVLEPEEGETMDYRAGQFLTFIFERQGKEVRRSYSLSSAPGIDPYPSVTVKKVENGEYSRLMLRELREGDQLKSLLPAGRFTFDGQFQGPGQIFLLAAGSGIVPVYSLLKVWLRTRDDLQIRLFYSNHNVESILFREAIEELAAAYPDRFSCTYFLSDPQGAAELLRYGGIVHGHLNNQWLESLVKQTVEYERDRILFYICGPFTYMRMALITLRFMGFTEEQLRREHFVIREPLPPRFRFPEGPYPKHVRLRLRGEDHVLEVPEKETILESGLRAGLDMPFSCRAGVCSTCIARCVEGEVEMAVNEVLTEKDRARGLMLTCVAYPASSDLHIEIGG